MILALIGYIILVLYISAPEAPNIKCNSYTS